MLITYNKWRTSSVPSTFPYLKPTDEGDGSSGSRRRKRLSSSSSTGTLSLVKLSTRFVVSANSSRERLLCLTSPHQLYTIESPSTSYYKPAKKASSQEEKDDDVKLCFESRPGKATSFLPTSNPPDISAVLDQSYGYALQDSNSTLVIYCKKKQTKKIKINPQDSSNIDNGLLDEKQKIKLSSPAISLEPLPHAKRNRTKGVIGTCLDGSIFIVTMNYHGDNNEDDPKVQFNCFGGDGDDKGEQKKHLGTFALCIDTTRDIGKEDKEDEDFSKKRKRQTSVARSGPTYSVCVLYLLDHHQRDQVTSTPAKKKGKTKKHKKPTSETKPDKAASDTGSSLVMMKHLITLDDVSDDDITMESKPKSSKKLKVTKSNGEVLPQSSVTSLNACYSSTHETINNVLLNDEKGATADAVRLGKLDAQTISLVYKNNDEFVCVLLDISNSPSSLVRPPFQLPLTTSPTENTALLSIGGVSPSLLAILLSTQKDNKKQVSYKVLLCDVHRANIVHVLDCNDDIHAAAVGAAGSIVVSDMITDHTTGSIALLLPQVKDEAAMSCRLNVATSCVQANLFAKTGGYRGFNLASSIASSSIALSSSLSKSGSSSTAKQKKNLKSLLDLTKSTSSTDNIQSLDKKLSSKPSSIEKAISSTFTKLREIRDSIQCFNDNKSNKTAKSVDGSTYSNAYFQGIKAIMTKAGHHHVCDSKDRVNGMKDDEKHTLINGGAPHKPSSLSPGKKHTMVNGGLSTPRTPQHKIGDERTTKAASSTKGKNSSSRTQQHKRSESKNKKVDSGGKSTSFTTKKKNTNPLMLLSQSFVKTTAALTIDVIMLLKKKNLPNIGDATKVLIHLILLSHHESFTSNATKLSIRSNLGDNFDSLLLACQSNDGEHNQDDDCNNAAGVTSLDMIDVILRCGKDVPERTLVSMLQYVLSHTTPGEVVAYFIKGPCSPDSFGVAVVHKDASSTPPKTKQKGICSSIVRLAHRYQQIKNDVKNLHQKGKEIQEAEEEELRGKLDSISNRLLSLAAIVFTERIVSYSGSNEALLRGALHHGLTSKNEITVAMQIFTRLLKKACGTGVIRWISALTDAHIGTLIGNDEDKEDEDDEVEPKFAFDPIPRMIAAVATAHQNAHDFFRIKDLVRLDSASSVPASSGKLKPIPGREGVSDVRGRERFTKRANDELATAPVANYCIELLEF